MTTDAVLGKWKLVSAGGSTPAVLSIKSHEMELRADGSWAASSEMQGSFAGMKLNFSGKWSLSDGALNYTAGSDSGQAKVRVVRGRLVLDPDFVIRKDGTALVTTEYER